MIRNRVRKPCQKLLAVPMLLGCIGSAYAQTQPSNLIQNSGFDSDLSSWTGQSSITGRPEAAEISYINNRDAEFSGALLLKAKPRTPDASVQEVKASQCIVIDNNQHFNLQAEFRYQALPEQSSAQRINLIWYADQQCSLGGQYGGYLEPERRNGWQFLENRNLLPALHAHSLSIELTQLVQASQPELGFWQGGYRWLMNLIYIDPVWPPIGGYWDNLQFTLAEPSSLPAFPSAEQERSQDGQQGMQNGHFDQDAQYWHLSQTDQWLAEQGANQAGAVRTNLHSDKGSMGTGVLRQCVNLGVFQPQLASANIKRDQQSSQTGHVRLRITWYERPDCQGRYEIDGNWVDATPNQDWQTLIIQGITKPENVQSLELEAIQSIQGTGDFAVIWDDFELR